MKKYLPNEKAMAQVAQKLAQAITDGAFIYFEGELGTGKTTFIRAFLKHLGIKDKIKSPTYTLIEPYEINEKAFFHFDLYRLRDPNELLFLGLEEYFRPETICLVEWPQKAENILPPPDIKCQLCFEKKGRSLDLIAGTKRGKEILLQCNLS